jgi:hypothetical protein
VDDGRDRSVPPKPTPAQRRPLDIFIRAALDRRLDEAETEEAIAERDADFDELRREYPELLAGDGALPIVWRAQQIANSIHPDLVNRPEFVDLIEAVTKTAILEGSEGRTFEPPRRQEPSEHERYRRPVTLEGAGGGSGPTRQESEDERWQTAVVAAARRIRPDL